MVQKVIATNKFRCLLTLFILKEGLVFAGGGIITDGSVGAQGYLGQPQTLSPDANSQVISIPASAGSLSGKNLFQSFDRFNIGSGQTVVFEDVRNNFLDNVIARVTGGSMSTIDGKLTVTPGGHANFYLLNPNGVLFGNGARIDVPGDFHVTTANYVKFQDGNKFGSEAIISKLSAAAPASFGFSASNHNNNALIQVSDGAKLTTTRANSAIDLVAPNIRIQNGSSVEALTDHSEIRLVAARAGLDVSLSKNGNGTLDLPNVSPNSLHAGNIEIKGHSNLIAESDGAGRIGEWGHDLRISEHSVIRSTNTGSHDAAATSGIEAINQSMRITDLAEGNEFSGLVSSAKGDGAGGNIHVSSTGSITIDGNSEIASEARSQGRGGNIILHSGSLALSNSGNWAQSGIFSLSQSNSAAGSINVSARGAINISGNTRIGSYAENLYTHQSSGDSGSISISSKSILVNDRKGYQPGEVTGFLVSQKNHDGRTGDITINTQGDLTIKGQYSSNGDPLGTSQHITGLSYNNSSTLQTGFISIHSGGHMSIIGQGSQNVLNQTGENSFRSASAYPGVAISSLDDDAHPGNLSISSAKGLSLDRAAFFSQSNAHFPDISVSSNGLLSLNHADIEDYLMNSHPDISRGASMKVVANEVLLTNNSEIHGSAPNTSITVLSKGDIFAFGNPLHEKDASGHANLGSSIFYHGLYGNGGIRLISGGTILLSNTIVGGVASKDAGETSSLHIRVSSENVVLNNSALLLNSAMNQLDLRDSQIRITTEALFPLANSLNKGFYTSGINVINFPGFVSPPSQNNKIQERNSNSRDANFEISGSLFGISGILHSYDPPNFDKDKIDNLCKIDIKGSLSLAGKGVSRHEVGSLWSRP